MGCLFCKIVNKEIPATVLFENEELVVFKDIKPQAPFHGLVIPKKHIETINEVAEEDINLLGKMIYKAKEIAQEEALAEDGYRLVFNINKNAGQEVFHIHLHLLGGRQLSWPPG